jgi:hypothetical protein
MDFEQLRSDLAAFTKARENTITIVHQIVEADGTLAEKIYPYRRQPRSHISEPQPGESNVNPTHNSRA